jgi:hypothetical protein
MPSARDSDSKQPAVRRFTFIVALRNSRDLDSSILA